MAPKTSTKRKAAAASQAAANSKKKQRVSLESADSLPTGSETAPCSSASLPSGADRDGASVAVPGPSAGIERVSFTSPTSSVAGPSSSAAAASVSTEITPSPSAEGTGCMQGESAGGSAPKTPQEILEVFAEDWLETVDKDEIKSISLFLCYHLVSMFSFTETKAAEYTAAMLKKNERTVRRWRSGLIDNDGVLPESQQGRYQRSGVLWQNEELNKKAVEYVRQNAAVKGRPNLSTVDFCKWVNECFLPN